MVSGQDFFASATEVIDHLALGRDLSRDAKVVLESDASRYKTQWILTVVLSILTLSLFAALAIALSRRIVRRLDEAKRFAGAVAAGNRQVTLEDGGRDEFGHLAASLRTMLGAIAQIETELRQKNAELTRQSWLRQGQIDLHDVIRHETATMPLVTKLASVVATYVGADLGALYLVDGENLALTGRYALPASASARLRLGEGLSGQAALERRTLMVSTADKNTPALKTAAVDVATRELLAVPLIYNDITIGVIELGAVGCFLPDATLFVESIAESLAIAVSSCRSRERIAELLEETRAQASELMRHQTQLEAKNAELARKSEELIAQQEELQQSNEELGLQRLELQEQKRALETINESLARTSQEVETKAEALTKASAYKSQFLANMSHELRTPLNSILILARILSQNSHDRLTTDEVEAARAIYASGNDLLSLINDILDLSKVEAGRLELNSEDVPLVDVVAALERSFRATAIEKGLDFTITVAGDAPTNVRTDRLRLEQILRNFVSNALKFTAVGGVHVTFKRAAQDTSFVRADLSRSSVLAIAVQDTGIGISPDKHETIFAPFQQADGTTTRQYGGTGLGLSIAHKLASLLGGEVALTSELGSGSTFVLYLPCSAGRLIDASDSHPTTTLTSLSQLTKSQLTKSRLTNNEAAEQVADDRDAICANDDVFLVVEDDALYALSLAERLRARGFKVLLETTGEAALNTLAKHKIDAVLLDNWLPGLSGMAILQKLKSSVATRCLPVFLMTTGRPVRDGLKLGAAGFLMKPIDDEALGDIVAKVRALKSSTRRRVLVVDDNATERDAIERLLVAYDVETIGVSSAAEALRVAGESSPDCIVLDLNLGSQSGFDFLEHLSQTPGLPRSPVVVYTGRDLSRADLARLEACSHAVIIKGVRSPERLIEELALFLHKKVDSIAPPSDERLDTDLCNLFDGTGILLVDDDMRNVYSMRQLLARLGFNVLVGKNGREAIVQLERHPSIRLVLMDVMMPEMDGVEATRVIRAMPGHAELPIIALTAKVGKGDRERFMSAGLSDYLAKPVDFDKLITVLKTWTTGCTTTWN
jgi:signal transduction histidine kinase/CheY-like chemotaxis protein